MHVITVCLYVAKYAPALVWSPWSCFFLPPAMFEGLIIARGSVSGLEAAGLKPRHPLFPLFPNADDRNLKP